MGQGALLARRLVEAGVRFVSVGKGDNAWDHHGNLFPSYANEFMPELDNASRALLDGSRATRHARHDAGYPDGRVRPDAEINVNNGRDHWPNCFSLVMAGGGVPKDRSSGSRTKTACS